MYLYDNPAAFLRPQNLGQPVNPPQYKEPFPNIKSDCPWEHRKAMDAYLALEEVKYFLPYYKQLYDAAHNASLSLDRHDGLVVNPNPETVRALVIGEVGSEVAKGLVENLANWALGERGGARVGYLLNVLDLLHKLLTIYEGIQNVKLVNEQNKSMREKALQTKLNFFIGIKARAIRVKNPGIDEFKLMNFLREKYWEYDQKSKDLLNYRLMEEGRCGKERIHQRMYERR
jgi:hypothetical protein